MLDVRKMKPAIVCLSALLAAGPAIAADHSCRHTAGAKQAARLVGQCQEVAESSHWPCHAANSCGTITKAIHKGCSDLNDGQPVIKPKFCKAYLKR